MKILITGGTGLIGSALIAKLLENNHHICALTRFIKQGQFPRQVEQIDTLESFKNLNDFDAVISLAGEPIFSSRWTITQKTKLLESRINLTQKLTALINQSDSPPHTFISGSATGYYGDQQDQWLTETSTSGTQFPAQLCQLWEKVAIEAKTRVCLLRTGMVFSLNGGALHKMLPLYRCGLGGKLGNGKQYWAWISLQDMINGILFLLDNSQCQGEFNLCAPYPITNQDFNQQLGKFLKRPYFMHVPAIILKLILGERAQLLLDSQRCTPEKLLNAGFQFSHPTFKEYLNKLSLSPISTL